MFYVPLSATTTGMVILKVSNCPIWWR